MVSGDECAGGVIRDEQAADRKPVCEPLGQRDEIGPDAELLVCKERPGSSDAALDLVEEEERPVSLGQLGGRLEEAVGRRD